MQSWPEVESPAAAQHGSMMLQKLGPKAAEGVAGPAPFPLEPEPQAMPPRRRTAAVAKPSLVDAGKGEAGPRFTDL
jgi:hypothetical protein